MGEGVVVRPDQVSLGVLVNAVPRDLADDAVAACGVREKRSDGKLPAHVITYLTLGLCLFTDDDYEEVATKVTGSLDRWGCWDAAWTVPTSSAIGYGGGALFIDTGFDDGMRWKRPPRRTEPLLQLRPGPVNGPWLVRGPFMLAPVAALVRKNRHSSY
jgi:hypothetical protein